MPALSEQLITRLEGEAVNLQRRVVSIFYFSDIEGLQHPMVRLIREYLIIEGENFPQGIGVIESYHRPQNGSTKYLCLGREVFDQSFTEKIYLGLRAEIDPIKSIKLDTWPIPLTKLKEKVPPEHRGHNIPTELPSVALIDLTVFLGMAHR